MLEFLGLAALGYLAGTGTATNACVVGRGLVRAVKEAVAGNISGAAVQGAGALVAPALMTFTASANLVTEVVDTAFELIGNSLDEPAPGMMQREAA